MMLTAILDSLIEQKLTPISFITTIDTLNLKYKTFSIKIYLFEETITCRKHHVWNHKYIYYTTQIKISDPALINKLCKFIKG